MPTKLDEREYRNFASFELRKSGENDTREYSVEGYASTYEPYTLFVDEDGNEYKEQIDPRAFDGADMGDVIFLYNHEGQVLARQKNGTLELTVDEHGLRVKADLGCTARSREMFDEIDKGLIDQMSFAFTVKEDDYDRKTHTRTIKSFRKLYDVSAVSIPANPTTQISARSWINGAIEQEKAERLAAEKRERDIARLKLLLEVSK